MKNLIVSADVKKENLSEDLVCLSSSHVIGDKTVISSGCILGEESPVILKNCQLGRNVRLKGGYFTNAIFLDGSSVGAGAHIRAGTILEEESSLAHTVGLKESIFFPFVKSGSLVNFCDVFISGGSSNENHSEIGSSYVHFNYTPNQDKATPSMFGDVARGVFLRENPIFLGGQGGAVGPIKVGYGNVISAGSILRNNYLEENRLISVEKTISFEKKIIRPRYNNTSVKIFNNLSYIGNLFALISWYQHIRKRCIRDRYDEKIYNSAIKSLETSVSFRIKKLDVFYEKILLSHRNKENLDINPEELQYQEKFINQWKHISDLIILPETNPPKELFKNYTPENNYLLTTQSLTNRSIEVGIDWLSSIVMKIEKLSDNFYV